MPPFTLATLPEATGARLAVIGKPIAHSLSPRMHQPALDEAGIDARYIALEIEPGQVGEAFARMRELGFIGCNVTVPHKFDALAACGEIDDTARDLGAVNTVRFDPDATRGTNTDGIGFEHAVRETLGLSLPGLAVMIVGAGGGAGGAIAAHCARTGVSRLILANRTLSKIEALAQQLRDRHPGLQIETVAAEEISAPAADLLVNTTSLGLKDGDPSPFPVQLLTPQLAVFDTIYQPTALIRAAQAVGAPHAQGNLMLLHQGIAAFHYWFPDTNPESAMRSGLGR
ncbi:shikimate dehydrogenase [Haloferula luteola]|uniref:Shikimate dehydrogenase (NADP(+)) n=1 Tax=Haloferula luteola TaxID=595692 RepID=A0A840VCR3_9BACT|nr:shikimate dehydrogenase [Haloferula luteola]MBB5351599.1 shikimate dehydrogenase [Haloferula luteola]